MKIFTPPIKSQGIKTKLIPWIKTFIDDNFSGRWIEPFSGTGAVAFNLAPRNALLCDINPHIINFYKALSSGSLTGIEIRSFLEKEGAILAERGESHYYYIRERFNDGHSSLDFLFLNRACFNGMIRFNRKGGFNVPFCRKPERFAKAYITKIVNQADRLSRLFRLREFEFKCQDFELTIAEAKASDILYCDPPYIDRHVDYYGDWREENELRLCALLGDSKAKFILSTWHHNSYRTNEYIESVWSKFNLHTQEHFYHVGGREKNRNSMIEALVTNIEIIQNLPTKKIKTQKELFSCEFAEVGI